MPGGVEHAPFEAVTIRDGSITARGLLPRGSTAFRVTNGGTIAHNLVIDGRGSHAGIEKPLAPGETLILEVVLRDDQYVLHCTLPGHHERAVVKTYEPR